MKTTTKVLGACIAGLIITASSNAITLTYEQDPDGAGGINIGDAYVGPVQIFVQGLSSSTVYSSFGGSGTTVGSTTVGTGIAGMDALPLTLAAGGIGSEDTWGIGFVTRIVDPVTNANVWTPLGKNQQLTGMFYGGTDFWARQDSPVSQTIAGVGLTFDIYEQSGQLPIPSLAGVLPTSRTALDAYPNFAPNGSPLLARFTSTNGFLDAGAGVTGTEVLTEFTSSVGSQGNVQLFASVDNTSGQLVGPGQNIFESNGFAGVFNSNLADARIVFSTQTLQSPNPWTVSIAGPIQTEVGASSVPEPGTALAALACLIPLSSRRRARN